MPKLKNSPKHTTRRRGHANVREREKTSQHLLQLQRKTRSSRSRPQEANQSYEVPAMRPLPPVRKRPVGRLETRESHQRPRALDESRLVTRNSLNFSQFQKNFRQKRGGRANFLIVLLCNGFLMASKGRSLSSKPFCFLSRLRAVASLQCLWLCF